MKIEPFDDGSRLMARAAPKVAPQTRAQQIRTSSNPYLNAVAKNVLRDKIGSEDHLHDKKIFYFDDGSFLTFEVSYMAIEDGRE